MKIRRFYEDSLEKILIPGKVFILFGPRRTGKTTLLNSFLEKFSGKFFFGSGEDRAVANVLGSGDAALITRSFAGFDLVVIDEAQAVKNIENGLKMLVDGAPNLRVIASGSSSFDLSNAVGEPLTDRKRTRTLFPLSAAEISAQFGEITLRQRLEELLVFGSYPEIFTTENSADKIELLRELRDSYLFKDILAYERIRDADKLRKLVSSLAFQIGQEVSLNELSRGIGMSIATVERYLDLLEKTFVIFKVPGFSKNLRSEITKTCRYYFRDNGVLNAVANNFNEISFRDGKNIGALWENFLVSEREKRLHYARSGANAYFWRTYERQEIDRVESDAGKLVAFKFKWNDSAKFRIPPAWKKAYPDAPVSVISPRNFTEFVC